MTGHRPWTGIRRRTIPEQLRYLAAQLETIVMAEHADTRVLAVSVALRALADDIEETRKREGTPGQ